MNSRILTSSSFRYWIISMRTKGSRNVCIKGILSGCLDFFTRSEKLGPDQKLNCQTCGEKRESPKQMSIIGKRFGNMIFAFDEEGEYDGSSSSSSSAEFEIFAVVTHSGMLESGHYVTYVKLKGLWYRCDDAWINEVEEEVVRGCECYMLFYAQERVIQKAHKELSYQVISMADAFPFAAC